MATTVSTHVKLNVQLNSNLRHTSFDSMDDLRFAQRAAKQRMNQSWVIHVCYIQYVNQYGIAFHHVAIVASGQFNDQLICHVIILPLKPFLFSFVILRYFFPFYSVEMSAYALVIFDHAICQWSLVLELNILLLWGKKIQRYYIVQYIFNVFIMHDAWRIIVYRYICIHICAASLCSISQNVGTGIEYYVLRVYLFHFFSSSCRMAYSLICQRCMTSPACYDGDQLESHKHKNARWLIHA